MHPPSAQQFHDIVASAAEYKLCGAWHGSGFRHHPRGVIRNNIIFQADWSVHHYCSASVILDPSSPIIAPISAPASHHNRTSPTPERGGTLRVYWSGSWSGDDGPWRQIIINVLADLSAEISAAQEARRASDLKTADEHRAAHAATVAAAHAACA